MFKIEDMNNTVEIKEAFDQCYLCRANLTDSQLTFIESLLKYYKRYKTLSPSQWSALSEIRKYMNEVPRYSMNRYNAKG
jgi:hypothetical protein